MIYIDRFLIMIRFKDVGKRRNSLHAYHVKTTGNIETYTVLEKVQTLDYSNPLFLDFVHIYRTDKKRKRKKTVVLIENLEQK